MSMTAIEAKQVAHRDAWIRNEAQKMANAIEAKQIACLVKPDLEAKIRQWINQAVTKQVALQLKEAGYLLDDDNDAKSPPPPTTPEVEYEEEEYVHMSTIKIDADSQYLPSGPPVLRRSETLGK